MTSRRLLSTSLTAGDSGSPRIVGGSGVYFELDDGRRLVDASNTACPLGHCHPEVIEAASRAARAPVLNEGWKWQERELAAEELLSVAFAGEDWVGAVRFFVSASEANDAVLALCQALSGRSPLVTRERAYHGGAGLSRELTVQPQWHGGLSSPAGIEVPPRLADVRQITCPRGSRVSGAKDTALDEDWRAATRSRLDGAAAVLLDYSQGGTYHLPEYQDAVAALARETGSIWIADETVTGFGRVGGWFQFQKATSRPDFVTLGKCMTAGGAPGGAVVVSQEMLGRLKGASWQSYSTYRAHPVAMAALRAHLSVSSREGIFERANELDSYMFEHLSKLASGHPSVARVDGRGLHWTVELHGPDWREWRGQETEPLATKVAAAAAEAGALIATSGEQTSLFIAPPLVVSTAELDVVFEALGHGLD
ncbi:MAG: aminotransferase class III-fold pyridoxal phosphate-dependent enzyme, partial [Acidimicrobiales bacterium]